MTRSLRYGVGAVLVTVMLLASASGFARQRGEVDLTVEAPASLAPAADRVRRLSRQPLADALARVGLTIPPQIHVTLIAEDDLRARAVPSWIVGLASGQHLGQREYARLIATAKVRPIKFHGLRHTCATLLLQAGEPVHVVAERLGHKRTDITLDVYAHVLPDMQQGAARRMNALLYGR